MTIEEERSLLIENASLRAEVRVLERQKDEYRNLYFQMLRETIGVTRAALTEDREEFAEDYARDAARERQAG